MATTTTNYFKLRTSDPDQFFFFDTQDAVSVAKAYEAATHAATDAKKTSTMTPVKISVYKRPPGARWASVPQIGETFGMDLFEMAS